MKTKSISMASAAALCAILTCPIPVRADGTATSSAPARGTDVEDGKLVEVPVPNADTNYYDDKLQWDENVVGWKNATDTDPVFCIPKHITLVGKDSQVRATTDTSGTTPQQKQYLRTVLGDGYFFGLIGRSEEIQKPPAGKSGKFYLPAPADVATVCPAIPAGKAQDLYDGEPVYVSSDDVARIDRRAGWDYGALAVPFKVQLSGKQAFSGSATLGGYLGYKFPLEGIVLRPIVFAGASNISTSATTGGTTTSQTVAGLSYGFGLLTTIKGSLQAGLVLGFDHVDSSQPYAYNDKPWLSLEIGYSFAQ
jgi:hypothetical protein